MTPPATASTPERASRALFFFQHPPALSTCREIKADGIRREQKQTNKQQFLEHGDKLRKKSCDKRHTFMERWLQVQPLTSNKTVASKSPVQEVERRKSTIQARAESEEVGNLTIMAMVSRKDILQADGVMKTKKKGSDPPHTDERVMFSPRCIFCAANDLYCFKKKGFQSKVCWHCNNRGKECVGASIKKDNRTGQKGRKAVIKPGAVKKMRSKSAVLVERKRTEAKLKALEAELSARDSDDE
ncbi:hypothetical protein CALCODRAFT_517596 [Calocera cornea HHB12733]|uniref:Uncharacterized protein n=1 Tax=Calocera cornea HHB12733 TaxID=1353952 RepID=A0A165FVW2_9BASI|nr:hypothetical protein CALCODRAFT_517596 [Calocera cornea HHB12733]